MPHKTIEARREYGRSYRARKRLQIGEDAFLERQRQKQRNVPSRNISIICETCEEPFTGRKGQRFCSRHCAVKRQHQNGHNPNKNRERSGKKRLNAKGYLVIYAPEHPTAWKHSGDVLEHRYVMEKHLGRSLLRTELVHHRNGNKQDNRIENLEIIVLPKQIHKGEVRCPHCNETFSIK